MYREVCNLRLICINIVCQQIYISRAYIAGFSLVADSAYISASLGRIMRALFEICLQRGWCSMAALLLEYCKAVDHRLWPHQHPLWQFDAFLSPEVLCQLRLDDVQQPLYCIDLPFVACETDLIKAGKPWC